MSSRKKKTVDGRTQAKAGIDAEFGRGSLELRGAHAAVEEGAPASMRAVSKAVQEMPHGARTKAESETE